MEEEISLRELIETIWRGKWLILIVTALSLIISAAATYIPKPAPLYKAEARIRIEQLAQENFQPSTGGYLSVLLNTLIKSEQYNADTFAELVKHPDLTIEVRKQLRFDERNIPVGYLTRNLNTAVDAGKTSLTVSLSHSDADFAKQVVNTVCEEFKDFLASRQRERIILVSENIERLISLELQNLEASLEGLEEARSRYQPLITYRSTSHLTPEYEILSQDIAHVLSQITHLKAQRSEIRDFRTSVAGMLRKVDDWVIITPASNPEDITPSPRKINIAIAGILGVMLSVFLVFFINYWVKSSPAYLAK